MAEQKMIVVIGVTGTQGGSVANTFLALPNWRVRGVTRNLESPSAQALAAKGVELVRGDLDDIESLRSAFRGANAIFGVTDFWSIVPSPPASVQAKVESGTPFFQAVGEHETQQALNIATAAADPEVLGTLERFVWSTLANVSKLSGGKYTNAHHFDSKARAEEHIRGAMPSLGERMSTINMGQYVENWRRVPGFMFALENGVYTFHEPADESWAKDKPWPQVVASKDTGVIVAALVIKLPVGTNVVGVSEWMSAKEYAETWGRVNGKRTAVKYMVKEDYVKILPPFMQGNHVDSFWVIPQFFNEFGWAGGKEDVETDLKKLGIEGLTSMEEFIKDENWGLEE